MVLAVFLLTLVAVVVPARALPPLPPAHHWERVSWPTAEATSWVVDDESRFYEANHPRYVTDHDRETAWVFDNEQGGVGEELLVWLPRELAGRRLLLRLRNGCQASESAFAAHRSIEKLEIFVDEDYLTRSFPRSLSREPGWQDVELVLGPSSPSFRYRLRLRVAAVSETPAAAACLSDLAVFIAQHDDFAPPMRMNQEGQKLANWIDERRRAAEHAGLASSEFPFASSQFELRRQRFDNRSPEAWARALGPLKALLDEAEDLVAQGECVHFTKRPRKWMAPTALAAIGVDPGDWARIDHWNLWPMPHEFVESEFSAGHMFYHSNLEQKTCMRSAFPDGGSLEEDTPPQAVAQRTNRRSHYKLDSRPEITDSLRLRLYDELGQLQVDAQFSFQSHYTGTGVAITGSVERYTWEDGKITKVVGLDGVDFEPDSPDAYFESFEAVAQ